MNERLSRIRHLALDMDGTIYKGRTLFEFTPPFLARMRENGIGFTFLTNNSSRSRNDYINHLAHMGIEAGADEIFTSTLSTVDYLHEKLPEVQRLFVLGTPSLVAEFSELGYAVVNDTRSTAFQAVNSRAGCPCHGKQEPEAVIIGFDMTLTYDRLCQAAWWIKQGKPFIATHPDWICPTDQPTVLVDCGSMCACLQSATGRKPDAVLGKPDRRMLTGILQRHNLQPNELAMIGDRLYTDVVMGRSAGALSVLVLTGEATQADVAAAAVQPDLVVPSLKEFGEMLIDARGGVIR